MSAFDLIMVPDPKKHSAKKGKARMYLCSTCKTRHASPTGAKCERSRKRRASGEDSTQSTQRDKRRRTSRLPRHSSPQVQSQDSSLEEETMNELLARLDGPPFPEEERTLLSDTVPLRGGAPSGASQPVIPGTSAEDTTQHAEPVTAGMFNMLCEQFAVLADTQTRDREQAERENKHNLDLITQSMASLSQKITASCQSRDNASLPPPSMPSTSMASTSADQAPTRSAGLHTVASESSELSRVTLPVGPDRSRQLNPQALVRSDDQVRTLRRHSQQRHRNPEGACFTGSRREVKKRWGMQKQ